MCPEYSAKFDCLPHYQELQRIVSRSLDFLYSGTNTPSGLQTDCDYLIIIKTIETQILAWQHEWTVARPIPAGKIILFKAASSLHFVQPSTGWYHIPKR